MSAMKLVLVVDESRSLIRPILEAPDTNYRVVSVPSAEEGLLELSLSRCDLLITTVRLPGMDGFELARRAKQLQPTLPMFVVAESWDAEDQRKGFDLGIHGHFVRPLDKDVVLTAVSKALRSSPPASTMAHASQAEQPLPLQTIRNRLSTLRVDTGATGIIFVEMGGEILAREVEDEKAYELPLLVSWMQKIMENSLSLAAELGSQTSFILQYHALETFKLYSVNVGRDYFLALFFAADDRSGGISMVSVFARRAVKDLLALLDVGDSEKDLVGTSELVGPNIDEADLEVPEPPEDTNVTHALDPALLETLPAKPLTDAEVKQLLALDFDAAPTDEDLDAFWSQAADEELESGKGLSLEEARQQGLIPSELTFDDD